MVSLSDADLEGASSLIQASIRNLAALPEAPLLPKGVSIKAQAAVAVILFQAASRAHSSNTIPLAKDEAEKAASQSEYEPEIHVVCTTRALHLRSHPGQGSLPGGKVDYTDNSIAETAFRETCEEILLSEDALRKGDVVHLCTLQPFLSKTALIVHPVVFWLPPKSTEKTLASLSASPDEVSAIWSYPLRAMLSSSPPRQVKRIRSRGTAIVEEGEELMRLMDSKKIDVHRPPQDAFRSYSDVPWLHGRPYRLHRFRSTHQLIKGLTADVLLYVAAVAYADSPFAGPAFDVHADEQAAWNESVAYIVERAMSGAPREKSRWGDGESGDGYGSTERHQTRIGTDVALADLAEDERQRRVRDLAKVLRQPTQASVPPSTSNGHADVELQST